MGLRYTNFSTQNQLSSFMLTPRLICSSFFHKTQTKNYYLKLTEMIFFMTPLFLEPDISTIFCLDVMILHENLVK